MPETRFGQIVDNAFDFLHKAIDEFEVSPKFSIVSFFTAMELFLKSRLLHEHWSLIYSKPEKASLNGFLDGDFHSITASQILKRIENVTSEKFAPVEKEVFEILTGIRNRVVHFSDEDVSGEKKRRGSAYRVKGMVDYAPFAGC